MDELLCPEAEERLAGDEPYTICKLNGKSCLIEHGLYTCDTYDIIKEENMEQVTIQGVKAYKVVKVEDGEYTSTFASIRVPGNCCTYKAGEITTSPSKDGITAFSTYKEAEHYLNAAGIQGDSTILEIIGIGELSCPEFARNRGWHQTIAFKAVHIVGVAKLSKPDKVLQELKKAQEMLGGGIRTYTKTGLHFTKHNRKYSLYYDEADNKRGRLPWTLHLGDRGKLAVFYYLNSIAPWIEAHKSEEEWIDVTKECTCTTLNSYAGNNFCFTMIKHKEWNIVSIGLGKPSYCHGSNYKVEQLDDSGFTYFKILKKVTV